MTDDIFSSNPLEKRFPDWTYAEIAFYKEDGSIMLVANSNASGSIPASHSSRIYKPDNRNYQKVFDAHHFNERTDDYHWAVTKAGKVLGEGWGNEIKEKRDS
jgi:hypothetical protein